MEPIFVQHCARCHTAHGIMGPAPEGYRLDGYAETLRSDDRALVAGWLTREDVTAWPLPAAPRRPPAPPTAPGASVPTAPPRRATAAPTEPLGTAPLRGAP